jgi:hypothetical protein
MPQNPHDLEKTVILRDEKKVWHYTCNPPDLKFLKKFKILPIGDRYGCRDAREVLLIPFSAYATYGLSIRDSDIKAMSEVLLRKIDLDNKK